MHGDCSLELSRSREPCSRGPSSLIQDLNSSNCELQMVIQHGPNLQNSSTSGLPSSSRLYGRFCLSVAARS